VGVLKSSGTCLLDSAVAIFALINAISPSAYICTGHFGEFSLPALFCASFIFLMIVKITGISAFASAKLNSHVIHLIVLSVPSSCVTAVAWHLSLQASSGILCATEVLSPA